MHSLLPFLLAATLGAASETSSEKDAKKTPARPQWRKTFDFIDQNKDEFVTEAEFVGGSLGKAANNKRKEFTAWDLDGDGKLSPDEFRKKGNTKPPPPPDPEKEFKRKDRDLDQKLSLKEFLAGRASEQHAHGLRMFYRYDANGDASLTLEELKNRGEGVELGGEGQFRIRDVDEDGKVSLEEFLFDRKKPQAQQQASRQFALFDYDGDRFLSREEFALLPIANPDVVTKFNGRDKDGDSQLSRKELALFLPRQQSKWARNDFRRFDADKNGHLSLEEFTEREAELERRKRARNRLLAEEWLFRGMISADVLVVLYIAFSFGRSHYRKRITSGGNASEGPVSESPDSAESSEATASLFDVENTSPPKEGESGLSHEAGAPTSSLAEDEQMHPDLVPIRSLDELDVCFGTGLSRHNAHDSDLPVIQSLDELLPDEEALKTPLSNTESRNPPPKDPPAAESVEEFDVK